MHLGNTLHCGLCYVDVKKRVGTFQVSMFCKVLTEGHKPNLHDHCNTSAVAVLWRGTNCCGKISSEHINRQEKIVLEERKEWHHVVLSLVAQ